MSLFRCSKCGCIENTAVSNYWVRDLTALKKDKEETPPLCSECDPEIGVWHNYFEKKSAIGMMIDSNGYLYGKDQLHTLPSHVQIVGEITE